MLEATYLMDFPGLDDSPSNPLSPACGTISAQGGRNVALYWRRMTHGNSAKGTLYRMSHGQDQGNGVGPIDCSKTDTINERANTDNNGSITRAVAHTTFHCCACYQKAVAYDNATIAKDFMEQAVRTAGDVVIDAKFNKEDTEEARAFLMEFIRKQRGLL
jgi:hypothetical protein